MRRMLIVVGCLGLVGVLAASVQGPVERWEYKVQLGAGSGIKPERHQAQLDSLGRDGWQLVAAVGATMMGNTGTVVLYLKRPALAP